MSEELFAVIAPQRATLYSAWVRQLAPLEWLASPLGDRIESWTYDVLGDLDGIRVQLRTALDETTLLYLESFALTRAVFRVHSHKPFLLEPLPLERKYVLPKTLLETRRYKGKTNELLTEFLLNLGWFASPWKNRTRPRLRVLDPVCGGGTSLFAALIRGWDAFGVEADAKTVETTVAYLKHFLRTSRVKHTVQRSRLKGLGRRWTFQIKVLEPPLTCVIAQGDTGDTFELLASPKAHMLIADFPYGVQHRGLVIDLITRGMNSWLRSLRKGATLVLVWDQRTLDRQELIQLIAGFGELEALDTPPWNQLLHPVDRVIKKRDILILRRTTTS